MSAELPFKKGDWVMDKDDSITPIFGVVKNCYPCDLPWEDKGKFLIDLVVYNQFGAKVGRRSPPEGGPTGFEPAISAERFVVIHEPDFPLRTDRFTRQYGHCLRPRI